MSEWTPTRLGDIISVRGGLSYKKKFVGEGASYLIGMGCVSHTERFLTEGLRKYGGDSSAAHQVEPGDLVIATRQQSENMPILGFPAMIPKELAKHTIIAATNLYKVTNTSAITNRFLYWLLKSKDYQARILKCAKGTTVRMITKDSIEDFVFNCPSENEREAITRLLDSLDDKIALNRRLNETLEGMARALFQSWFVDFDPVKAKLAAVRYGLDPERACMAAISGKLRIRPGKPKADRLDEQLPEAAEIEAAIATLDSLKPAALDNLAQTAAHFPADFQESELGLIPAGWEVGTIQDCCVQIQNGGTPRRNEPRFWNGGNIPWLASGEVRQSIITATENFITEEGLAESSAKWAPAFSTVVALYGATAGQVSFTSARLTTNQAVCALIPKKGFAFFNYLTMRGATAELENKAVGSAQQNISKGIVEEAKVVLPPPALVERFAALASPLFDRWISNLHQSRTLAELRDTLLPKLLSGEIAVGEFVSAREAQ